MKKPGALLFCLGLCLTVAFFFTQLGQSEAEFLAHGDDGIVDSTNCITSGCHVAAFGAEGSLHGVAAHSNCAVCHDGTPAAGNVFADSCVVCHPVGNAGTCPLVDAHEAKGADCLSCHQECEQGTTTTTSTPVGPCPSEEIYGENSAEVMILRALRDGVLSKTPEGREMIKLYYQWAPMITIAIRNDPALKAEIKAMVDGILGLSVE